MILIFQRREDSYQNTDFLIPNLCALVNWSLLETCHIDDQIKRLGDVFQKVRALKLKFSPMNFRFFKKEVPCLRNIVPDKRIAVDDTMITAVYDCSKAQTRTKTLLCTVYSLLATCPKIA